MATYRVKAFFMHESEFAAAKRAEQAKTITDTEWTDGYVIALIDEAQVIELVRQGLIVTPIERVESAEDSARRLRSGVGRAARSSTRGTEQLETSIAGKTDAEKILSRDLDKPQFYVVRLVGPLTPRKRSALRQENIEFLERLIGNHYTVRLAPEQVRWLSAQSFVDTIRLYDTADTLEGDGGRTTTRAVGRGSDSRRFTRLFAVRTHRSEDLQKVVEWLQTRRLKPIATHPDALQVALVQDGQVLTDLPNYLNRGG